MINLEWRFRTATILATFTVPLKSKLAKLLPRNLASISFLLLSIISLAHIG